MEDWRIEGLCGFRSEGRRGMVYKGREIWASAFGLFLLGLPFVRARNDAFLLVEREVYSSIYAKMVGVGALRGTD